MKKLDEDIFDGIIPQRKAFIDWINNNFYKEQINNYKGIFRKIKKYLKNNTEKIRRLKIYQYFVKDIYLLKHHLEVLLVYIMD